nr:reverse transcriptase domain-containing protein [Tanacetum cinerariifolium]
MVSHVQFHTYQKRKSVVRRPFEDSCDDLKEAFLENYLQQKNASKIQLKLTISSREMGNPRKSSCGGRLPEPTKAEAKARQIHPPHKNTKRNSGFGQREVQASSPMITPVEKRNARKFCEFHKKVRHTTDECMHLKRQIEKMLKVGKLSHLIKELKQSNGKDQEKATKKEETSGKEKTAGNTDGTTMEEGGQTKDYSNFLFGIGDEEHSTSAWMNFMIIRSPSPYNGIIRRPGVKRIQAVPSTAHGMLKFLVTGKMVTLRSSKIIPLECVMVSGPRVQQPDVYPLNKRKRGQAPDRNKAIYEEVEKLVDAGIMKEVHYHSWVSNPVMVKKHDGSWRIQNLEVYVVHLVIKNCTKQEVIRDIEETFETHIEINMKLNLKKYTFGMREGMFLGYKENADGLNADGLKDDPPDTPMEDKEELSDLWILFTDGSSCIDGSKAGLIITCPEEMEFTYALRFRFNATNNEAEYEALIASLRIAKQIRVKNFKQIPLQANYWPTMHADTRKLIRECTSCQVYCPVPKNPQQKLTTITSPWPFYKWGIDIAGPFLEGSGEIISDNGKQFRDNPFKDLCINLCIRQYPQANGLVERANRSLGEGIKARLDERSKNWMEEVLHVIWAHRTMIKYINGETPFSLTYGTKAVIPVEIGMPTLRTTEVDMIKNDEALEINLELLEEKREKVSIQEAKSKAMMEKYYNARVRNTSFKPGDLVYRSNEASHAEEGGKLRPKWERPYEVTEALGKGAYKLRGRDRSNLP